MSNGATDFAALVFSRLHPRWKGMSLAAVAQEQAALQHLPLRAYYARMKRAVRPLLEADAETLSSIGIPAPKKRTTTALAESIALWSDFPG